MTQEKTTQAVFDFLGKVYEEHAADISLTLDDIQHRLGMPKGPIQLALKRLEDERLIYAGHSMMGPSRYNMNHFGYERWQSQKVSQQGATPRVAPSDTADVDVWEAIEIEHPMERAGELDELAQALAEDNGYKASYPEEATQTIFTLRGLSQSLKNTGKATKEAFVAAKKAMGRLKVIFNLADKTVRISEMWMKVSEWLDRIVHLLTS